MSRWLSWLYFGGGVRIQLADANRSFVWHVYQSLWPGRRLRLIDGTSSSLGQKVMRRRRADRTWEYRRLSEQELRADTSDSAW
jgi:hypothetical protein